MKGSSEEEEASNSRNFQVELSTGVELPLYLPGSLESTYWICDLILHYSILLLQVKNICPVWSSRPHINTCSRLGQISRRFDAFCLFSEDWRKSPLIPLWYKNSTLIRSDHSRVRATQRRIKHIGVWLIIQSEFQLYLRAKFNCKFPTDILFVWLIICCSHCQTLTNLLSSQLQRLV